MKKPSKSPLGIIKIALLIPAVLITLGLTTGMTPQQKTINGKVIFADTGEPATGASIVIRHGTVGTVVDRDGTFALNMDGNPELVISFVGYSTLIVKASEIGKKPLKLELKDHKLDLESAALEVSKKPSGAVSLKMKDGSDAQPVFVLDGKVVKDIEGIDPETIESISVLKDPNDPLVKKYNAKDGLIQITSKKDEKLQLTPKEAKDIGDELASNDSKEEVFYIVEDMPKFPGGIPALRSYIYSNLEYPEKAKSQGIKGEVIVRFLVNEKGQVVNEEVLRSSYEGFETPALKVISEMPDWTPGMQRGKAVKVWYSMSINYDSGKK